MRGPQAGEAAVRLARTALVANEAHDRQSEIGFGAAEAAAGRQQPARGAAVSLSGVATRAIH